MRIFENKPGVVYDETKTTVIFAEDMNDIQATFNQFQTEIDNVPQNIPREMLIKVIDDATALTTGDGKIIIPIPESLNGKIIVYAEAFVVTPSTSGAVNIQIRNVTDAVDIMATPITIDANEKSSYTAATRSVAGGSSFALATGDEIAVDVDGAGTGTKGLAVCLTFGNA